MSAKEDLKQICNQLVGRFREGDGIATCILPKSIHASGIDVDFAKNKLQLTISGTPYFIKSEKPMMLDTRGHGEIFTTVFYGKESAIFGKIKFKTIRVKDIGKYTKIEIDGR